MAFRIGDTIVVVESGLTEAEKNAIVPGKGSITSSYIICNPKIAACQRACGLDPHTDTTVFGSDGYNIIPFGQARICDIFDSCDTLADCISAEYSWCIGKGADLSWTQDNAGYGTFLVAPTASEYVVTSGGTQLSFNNTSVHYCLSVGFSNISCTEYATNYSKRFYTDASGALTHSISTSSTNIGVMVIY